MTTESITERDLRDFVDRLVTFGSELPAREQIILREILTRAARFDEADVEGYAIALPLPLQSAFAGENLQAILFNVLEEIARTSPDYYALRQEAE